MLIGKFGSGLTYVGLCVLFTVYGQLIIKWRTMQLGEFPSTASAAIKYIIEAFTDIYILSGFLSALIAAVFWIAAISKLQLNYAYPFMSSAFVLVMILSLLLFGERLDMYKLSGMALIMLGIYVSAQSSIL